jgi:hypothetical protein
MSKDPKAIKVFRAYLEHKDPKVHKALKERRVTRGGKEMSDFKAHRVI